MYQRKESIEYLDLRNLPTRQHDSIKFHVPFTDKTTVMKSVQIRGTNAWNQLPNQIKELPSKSEFMNYTKCGPPPPSPVLFN